MKNWQNKLVEERQNFRPTSRPRCYRAMFSRNFMAATKSRARDKKNRERDVDLMAEKTTSLKSATPTTKNRIIRGDWQPRLVTTSRRRSGQWALRQIQLDLTRNCRGPYGSRCLPAGIGLPTDEQPWTFPSDVEKGLQNGQL